MINGTQVSTALAVDGLLAVEKVFAAALVAGALSLEAALGQDMAFDERLHEARGQPGQIRIAAALRALLAGSGLRALAAGSGPMQDPYSLRCQPQVMGACLDVMRQAAGVLEIEANAVSDNPLVFPETGEVLSGGNFHAEPVAFAADMLALAAAEIGALSERRIALLMDGSISDLPPFLTEAPGLNSGFMIAQVTAVDLLSELRILAHPASVDSVTTSANQEDHVSMGVTAARKAREIAANVEYVLAIEWLCAAQAREFHRDVRAGDGARAAFELLRTVVPKLEDDRYIKDDIDAAHELLCNGRLVEAVESAVGTLEA